MRQHRDSTRRGFVPSDSAAGSEDQLQRTHRQAPGRAEPVAPAARARREAARGEAFLQRGQFQSALACFREAVTLAPQEAAYHVGLAGAAEGSGLEALVEHHGAEATRLAPDDARAHFLLGRTYYRNGKFSRGVEHSGRAVEVAPDRVDYVVLHGSLLLAAGRAREAAEALEPLLASGTTDRWVANLYARVAPSIKQEARALEVVKRALLASNLSADPSGKPLLHFAAATLLDRLGRHDEAFEQARLGNETVRTTASRHDPDAHSAWVSRKIKYFTRERVESLPRATHDSDRPVFILGMPRSGTTLVEQILACHPSVYPGGEMQSLRLVAKQSADADWAAGESYPEYFDDLSLGHANRLAAKYLADIDALGRDARFVTDKQPLNFLILDMVELLFPRSRVIHCVRGPLDTCLSCYMTNFELHNPFKYDLGDLGRYYHDYARLMEHWKSVLTVPVLDVRYEDLVLDTRGQVRRMLEFLGLPWDDRCLRYYENERPVHTASVDQVRKPIYTASIGRWKHYEKHLRPLIDALGSSA
jgi:Flp pilus assembly protein TadD